MKVTKDDIKAYSCVLSRSFLDAYTKQSPAHYPIYFSYDGEYDTNLLLEFLYDYPEVADMSKEYFFFLCLQKFKDVPNNLIKKYKKKFGLVSCGDNIYNSYGCRNSNLLLNCNGVSKSFGCDTCKFSDHLIYCKDRRHVSYQAFNKSIKPFRYMQLIKMSPEELKKTPEFDAELYNQINHSLYCHYYKDKS